MGERALSFGVVAAAYERYRPGYPDDIVDQVLEYAGRPVRTALEIGAGTGKAARVFARRGIAVTATDPDAAMLDELRVHVPSTVTTVQARLEDLSAPTTAYDLVYAAASLHWTEPSDRWAPIAAMLVPGGTFASFGGQTHLADPDDERAVRAATAGLVESDDVPSPDGTPADSPMQWPGTELGASTLFGDVRQSIIERRLEMSAVDYVGLLSTVSAYLMLPERQRSEVLDRIAKALPDPVRLVADITLHLARSVSPAGQR